MSASGMDRKTIDQAKVALEGSGGGFGARIKRVLPFLGPAVIASIAYVDPGNFATNIQAGAQFGYTLLWVIFASNLMAMLIQALAAKLGIATGKNLAEQCGQRFPKSVAYTLWIMMELAAMATDLAEFLGAAVAFNLLFGMPLWVAGLLTALCTFGILALQRYGFRPLEAVIAVFVGVISLCYLAELIMVKPVWGDVLPHAVLPSFQGKESVVLAVGILGATIMPHAIFLHSALTQDRIPHDASQRKRLFRFEIIDVIAAMGVAGLINAAMLIVAAGTFFVHGMHAVGTLEEAHKTLEPLLGSAASTVFAVSLLASGLSSSTVGTQAGQIIIQGFIKKDIPIWVRRLITVVPSLVVIFLGMDPTRTLILSQVVLSFCLPLAIVPLMIFTNDEKIMGDLVNKPVTKVAMTLASAVIIALDLFLVYNTLWGG